MRGSAPGRRASGCMRTAPTAAASSTCGTNTARHPRQRVHFEDRAADQRSERRAEAERRTVSHEGALPPHRIGNASGQRQHLRRDQRRRGTPERRARQSARPARTPPRPPGLASQTNPCRHRARARHRGDHRGAHRRSTTSRTSGRMRPPPTAAVPSRQPSASRNVGTATLIAKKSNVTTNGAEHRPGDRQRGIGAWQRQCAGGVHRGDSRCGVRCEQFSATRLRRVDYLPGHRLAPE